MLLNNGVVEAVIVPEIGRVMQFRFLGSSNGPFWENPTLSGQIASSSSWNTEGSFGGDKPWPAPQSDWGWPPPSGFDGSPYQVTVKQGAVTMLSPVDSTYKVRTTRIVELVPNQPAMRIKTIFQRMEATAETNKPVGVWIITQVREPVRVYVPVPAASIFPNGYRQFGSDMPAEFRNENGLISFARDPRPGRAHKLGFDAGSMVWVGTNLSLRIDAPRIAGAAVVTYPDHGCSTEVYTHSGTNAPYIELECLGPLSPLAFGEQLEFVTTYTLYQKTESNPDAEARKVLNQKSF